MEESSTSETIRRCLADDFGWDLDSQPRRLEDTLKNKKLTFNLLSISKIIRNYSSEKRRAASAILFELAGKINSEHVDNFTQITKWIVEGQVKAPQLEAISELVKQSPSADINTIYAKCGVGQFVTEEQICQTVADVIAKNLESLITNRYRMVSSFHVELRQRLPWADKGQVTRELNAQLLVIIGPKAEGEIQRVVKKTKPSKADKKLDLSQGQRQEPLSQSHITVELSEKVSSSNDQLDLRTIPQGSSNARIQESISFPMPSDNVQLHPHLLDNHILATGGIVVTRFPPEPNGFLHIGHAKAMNLNFGYAKKMDGKCILRFDDTNPEAETQEYIDSIINTVEWLGNKPCAITYASDYFDQLYEFAVDLIKRGKAFVCHQKPEEYRGANNPTAKRSIWRDRPIEENLKLFNDMKEGRYQEGEATLRMKMDLDDPNPCMWDLVAYRIKYHPHPHVGDKWCIYPSYDFTHCINDSIEHISHSLCSLEYVIRRQSYYWLLDALEIYKPVVWEYGRLNLTHTVLSKRLLVRLVRDKVVRGWDDPRMPTISGYRRRGYTPESINHFCEEIGVTRADGVFVPIQRLNQSLREHLDPIAIRLMAVINPLKVTITNLGDEPLSITRQNLPGFPDQGTNVIQMMKVVYIERQDFREDDIPNYRNLTLNTKDGSPKWVRLRYGPIIAITEVIKDDQGEITELLAQCDLQATKAQGTIHWVSAPVESIDSKPLQAEFRLYDHLFKSEKPQTLKGKALLADINPNSLAIHHGYVDPTASKLKRWDHIQFERLGFFNVDPDSFTQGPTHFVFNRSASLNEAKDKPQ